MTKSKNNETSILQEPTLGWVGQKTVNGVSTWTGSTVKSNLPVTVHLADSSFSLQVGSHLYVFPAPLDSRATTQEFISDTHRLFFKAKTKKGFHYFAFILSSL